MPTIVPSRFPSRLAALCAILVPLVACGSGEDHPATRSDSAQEAAARTPPPPPYRVIDVPHGATIRGRVVLAGIAPADSIVAVTSDTAVCGTRSEIAPVDLNGRSLEGVLVWLEDARSGKPLPLARRYTMAFDDCAIDPPLQGAVVGGTINVDNEDETAHTTRFLRDGTTRTLAVVHETDEGQTVPVAAVLHEAGRVEIRCDLHPWTRAWLQVFDHPYFDLSARDGRFVLDSVPPGRYTLVAWQPRLGERRRSILLSADSTAEVEIAY